MADLTPESIARVNIRHFIVFRVLFNARFYYPIFAVIFLDFGLTLDQFAMLNAIWAVTIILAEVPSGALSDLIGRKKLLILTASLMVMEMAVWVFAPTENPTLLFWMLAFNRLLSGLAEAAASGSDEALVYDSLEAAGMKDRWSSVLESVSRWQAVAFTFAMVTGGLIYDPGLMERAVNGLGMELQLDKSHTLRLPLYLTLATAALCWLNNLGFIEARPTDATEMPSVKGAFRQTFLTAIWIGKTPFALVVILAGAFADSIIRMFVTLGSEYYRLIQYPEYTLGIIGSAISILNFFVAPVARRLVDQRSPTFIFVLICVMAVGSFYGISLFIPYWGLIFACLLFVAFFLVSFSISYYLNQISEKSIRATVLSFKGMALNLGYGLIGVLYAQLLRGLSEWKSIDPESDRLFVEGTQYFTPYFCVGALVVIVFSRLRCPEVNSIAERLKKNGSSAGKRHSSA